MCQRFGSSATENPFDARCVNSHTPNQGVVHAISSIGPFLFLEEAMGRPPPFGAHPHAGLYSLTIPLRGKPYTRNPQHWTQNPKP